MELIGTKIGFSYNTHIVAILTAIISPLFFLLLFWLMDKGSLLNKWKKDEIITKKDLFIKGWLIPILVVIFMVYALWSIYSNLR